MQILLVLIPVSLLLLVAAVGAFFWAVRRGQFENLDRAALDILVDDRAPRDAASASAASVTAPMSSGDAAAGPAAAPTEDRHAD